MSLSRNEGKKFRPKRTLPPPDRMARPTAWLPCHDQRYGWRTAARVLHSNLCWAPSRGGAAGRPCTAGLSWLTRDRGRPLVARDEETTCAPPLTCLAAAADPWGAAAGRACSRFC